MESVAEFTRQRIARQLYVGDLEFDVEFHRWARCLSLVCEYATSQGWVTAEGWRNMSDELFPGIVQITCKRLEERFDGLLHQSTGKSAETDSPRGSEEC